MRKVAVTGAGMTPFGEHFSLGIKDLLPMAFAECAASVDKGITKRDIQAAWFGQMGTADGFPSGIFADTLGLPELPVTRVENSCATGQDAIRNAMFAIAAGAYDVALVMGADTVREITLEEVLAAPMVANSIGVFDCEPQSDGAAAVILAFPSTVRAAKQAFSMAGITPSDIDVAEVHDFFTGIESMSYEDLGFAERFEAYKLVEADVTAMEGALPVNPSGGLKAKRHPPGATGVAQCVELFGQLRGGQPGRRRSCRSGTQPRRAHGRVGSHDPRRTCGTRRSH